MENVGELLNWVQDYRSQKIQEKELIFEILQQKLKIATISVNSDYRLDSARLVKVWDWNLYILEQLSKIGLNCSFAEISGLMKFLGFPIFIYTDEHQQNQSFYFGIQYRPKFFPERLEMQVQKIILEFQRKDQFSELENLILRETCS